MSDTYSQFIFDLKQRFKDNIDFDNGDKDVEIILDIIGKTKLKKLLLEYDNIKTVLEEFDLQWNHPL